MDPSALTEVSGVLEGLSRTAASVENDLLSCLVVMGEPDAQAVVDGWVDQFVDLLRAVDETTERHVTTLARVTSRVDGRPTHDEPAADARAEAAAQSAERP
ncbi:hypothetical protein N803_16430 [Knoellia subterranea KCTC 19937]|uniref:Uncharacterized protein n=1 Tax=Knoellia subterranea KCTC 19937 TaxID=1385521 RepID=A0A0A0JLW8_9MICO|nr:hypothetical protein N803_16430 [Knoellia subterranea KCTC 19937]